MTHDRLLERVVTDPAICHGKPCVGGHRIWVSLIVDLLVDGITVEQLLEQYIPDSRPTTFVRASHTPQR